MGPERLKPVAPGWGRQMANNDSRATLAPRLTAVTRRRCFTENETLGWIPAALQAAAALTRLRKSAR